LKECFGNYSHDGPCLIRIYSDSLGKLVDQFFHARTAIA
jgi:hypothetical protein